MKLFGIRKWGVLGIVAIFSLFWRTLIWIFKYHSKCKSLIDLAFIRYTYTQGKTQNRRIISNLQRYKILREKEKLVSPTLTSWLGSKEGRRIISNLHELLTDGTSFYVSLCSVRTRIEHCFNLCLVLIDLAGGLYRRILTEVVSTDRTQWLGLYSKAWLCWW